MPRHLTLKQRVTLALTALVSLFVALQGGLAYLSMHEQEDDLVDELVLAEARRLTTSLTQDGSIAIDLLSLSPNFSGWLQLQDGEVSPVALPEYLRGLSPGPHRFHGETAELHVYVMPTAKGVLYVQYDAAQNEAKVREFGYYLLGLCLMCIAVSVLAAYYLAAVVVAPVERVTRMLGEWAPGTAPTNGDASDEEARLLAAFRRVQERFEASIAHEREFVANARHEIRTPLTALRTDLEMLSLNVDTELQPRLQRALESADAIAGSLDLVHTLTHRPQIAVQSVELAQCVDAAWRSLEVGAGILPLGFSNQVDESVRVSADRHALLTILRNLIRNAAEHAAATHCTVSHTARGIEIADDGVGIATADLPLVFDRYYRGRRMDAHGSAVAATPGDGERGLGLAIARQVADLNGWQLTVESTVGSGTCFILNLMPA